MAAFNCCGNQPTPIIIGLLVTYLTGLIDCYPLLSSPLTSDNKNLGQVIYRPNFNPHPSAVSPSSSSSLSSQSPSVLSSSSSSSSSSLPAPVSINSPLSSSSSSSPPVASQPSQQLPQSTSPYHHHSPSTSSSSSSLPGITFIQGPISDGDNNPINLNHHRPTYQDYLDTFRLPLISTNQLEGGNNENNNDHINPNRLTIDNKPIVSPKFILTQPSTSPIDFDYVPLIQSDFNQQQPSYGSERSGLSDLYEDDYSDPIYDLKYDPIDDSNWLNEPTLSSYQQQQSIPALPTISFISKSPLSPYSSYSPYNTLPLSSSSSSSVNSGPSSEEMLTNLMVDYFVKELEKNAHQQQHQQQHQHQQQQSYSQSPSESVEHLIRLQQKQHHPGQQQQQPIDELKTYEGYMVKKSSLSSFNRDKGSTLSKISTNDQNNNNPLRTSNNKKIEMDSVKRIEQRGQKEYPMLRPATENNGKDDLDNQSSLTSQLKSLSSPSSSSSSPTSSSSSSSLPVNHQPDDEVNQLKSLLQSA